jgi:hypothetical protein
MKDETEMTTDIVDGEIVGLTTNEVTYPLLVSLQGETKRGKTYFGASFPNAFVLDFAPSIMSFGKVKADEIAMTRTVGEGFRSIFNPVKRGEEVHWVSKIDGFNFKQQYVFIKSLDHLEAAVEKAKMFKETLSSDAGKVWIVVDDTTRWRSMEVLAWFEKNKKWPIKEQFGQITQGMQSKLSDWQNDFNVLLIHKMSKSFETGEPVAQVYPSNADYVADCNIEIGYAIKDGKQHQVVKVHSNGHCFACNENYIGEIVDPDPMTVLSALRVPRELW